MQARAAINRGITAHRLRKNITLYVNESTSPVSPVNAKPLVLMLPWLGARRQALAKYSELYFRAGFDVLAVESELKEFLWPRRGLEYGERVLELLQSERLASRPLLVHAFSVGGYTFAQMLVHVSRDTQKYQGLTCRFRGHVYDSLVVGSLDNMAVGLGKTIFPRWEKLVTRASLLYFGIFKHQTVDYFNTGIDAFWNTPVSAPALFFFCENDPMNDPRVMEEVIDNWRKRGIDVTAKKWADSTHAGHLKRHPREYVTTLDTFLQSLSIAPPKDI